jgi:RNA polymerase sigma factor (sigma-70 family)
LIQVGRSDSELWESIRAGDEVAWRQLVQRYKALVYSVCTYTGLSLNEAADVFQDTWLQLFRHLSSVQDPSRLSSWLITTTRREAVRVRKRNARFTGSVDADTPDQSDLPDEHLEQLELQAHLEIALGEIDLPCRKILHEFFFASEEHSYDEIAKALGYSPNTLGAKRRRCLERLKGILAGIGYER